MASHARAGGTAWVAEVERACAAQGLQLTAARRSVLDILGHSRAALGAYAILDALARKDGKPVAPPTVYRALDFFLAHGLPLGPAADGAGQVQRRAGRIQE